MQTSRLNTSLADLVESAIRLSAAGGQKVAVDLMLEGGVNFRTVVRVLAEPSRRRAHCSTPSARMQLVR